MDCSFEAADPGGLGFRLVTVRVLWEQGLLLAGTYDRYWGQASFLKKL
jgi:hypothetical protein